MKVPNTPEIPAIRLLKVVKSYVSNLDGDCIRLVMFRKNQRYGIVTLFKDAAVARDYSGDSKSDLRTLPDYADSIIDWVPIGLANERWATEMLLLLQTDNQVPPPADRPALRIVPNAR